MFSDFTALDAAALVAFVGIWLVYNTLFDGWLLRPNSINAKMVAVREAWMQRLLRRDNRIVDATLVGHSFRSATFFASTTILVIAGLVGIIGSAESVHGAVVNLSVLLRTGTQALFEFKVFMLISIFVYAFFKFTWAIRQFNYFSAIIGSAPDADEGPFDGEGAGEGDGELARRMALILSHAVWQLNAGIRAYYFALAALARVVHPPAVLHGHDGADDRRPGPPPARLAHLARHRRPRRPPRPAAIGRRALSRRLQSERRRSLGCGRLRLGTTATKLQRFGQNL